MLWGVYQRDRQQHWLLLCLDCGLEVWVAGEALEASSSHSESVLVQLWLSSGHALVMVASELVLVERWSALESTYTSRSHLFLIPTWWQG